MGSSPPSSPDPDDDPSAAMMAAMGFSSFGGPDRPSKKRRFNPHADAATTAVTLGPAPSSLPPKPPAPTRRSATGANQLPLHPRGGGGGSGAAVGGGAQNDDEIDLDLDDEPGQEVSGPAPADDPESRYIDTSRPPAPLEDEGGDDGFGGELGHPTGPPGITGWQPSHGPPPRGRGGGYGRGRGRGRGGGGSGHVPGQAWSVGYYDPSSNENPWGRLETARGLRPVGSWLAPGHGRSG